MVKDVKMASEDYRRPRGLGFAHQAERESNRRRFDIFSSLILLSSHTALKPGMASLFASSSSSSSLVARRLTKAATAASRPFSTTSVPRAPRSAKPGKHDDDFQLNKMEPFEYDDVPTPGHLMINRQREILKYHRIVEHEFPALKSE